MKKRRLLLLPALFLSVLASLSFWPLTHEARAIPAYPEMLIHSQSNGDVINYYIKGDEFLNWMTDANGWLVSFGDTEETSADLYQAEWISENQAESARENVSEGVPEEESWPAMGVIKATTPLLDHKLTPPRPGGMPPNIREEVPPEYLAHIAAEAAAWRDAASAAMREGADSSASKSAPQLIVRSPAAAVTRKGVVIYVRFPNDSRVRNVNFGVSDETFLNNYMFGSGDKSVASFYRDNTGGAAQIGPANESQGTANDGVIVVNLSGNHGNWGGSIGGTWASDLFAAALQGAAPYINFASYDTNNDGTIEPTELFIALVVQGGESSYGDNIPSVWGLSVRWSNPGVSISGISKRFVNVFQQGATQGGRPLTIGIGAHELGHALFGFPDLYDVGGNCPGFGYWSLMAQGSWSYQSGERPGATPSMIDAYCLYSAGLVTPDAILNSSSSGTYTASGHTGIYRVSASSPNQYFLLQPRDAATPRDRGAFYMIPSGGVYSSYLRKGLMIIHVDQSVTGSFNSGAQPHPGRAVEEAHGGGFNLLYPKYNTNAGGNNGDIADLFGSKPSLKGVFDGTTNPNTNLYNSTAAVPVGGQNTASGISIFDIEPTPGGGDDAMNFTMGAALPVQLTSIDITNSSEVVITAAVPLTQGNSAGLSHIKSPTNANGTFQYAWSSSNTSVVTVTPTAGDSGMTATINSVTPGSADITLTVRQDLGSDGSVDITMTDTISVSVTNISHTGSNWYVKVGGSGDGSGNNWDNAAGDLSLVMHLADDGDNIYVAEGTYTPTRDVGGASPADVRNRTFSVEKSYTLSGGYPNTAAGTDRSVRDPWTYRTVLDGENVSYHVMRLFSVAVTVDVDGFTLTRGNAIGTSGRGGGVYIEGGYPSPGNSSSSTFRNCRFIDNISTGHGPAAMADGYGGSSGVNASFINCTFSGNFSSGERGTVMWDGDTYGVLSFENCTFFNNNSSSPEVDAVILTRTTTTVKNCTFVDNFWTAGASARYAIRREGGTVTVSNSLFVRSGITANTNGGLADGGYNIFGPNPGVSLNTTSLSLADSAVNVDPFGPAYNGGANETLALISGSPAINKISSGYPATDQRGVARPVGAGGDVGAFEFEGAAPVSPMTMNPKTIVALVGDRNLIFTVWPTDSGTTVPTSGTWSSSNSAVASVVSTTPSAAGYPRGRVSALTAGFSEITYTSGSMTASGRVEIIRTSGSPPVPIPESEPEPEPSPDFSGLPIERISDADSTLIAGGETLDLVYPEPTDVTVSENPSEGFEPADDELVVRGESRMFEITYDASNIKDEDAAKIPALAIELSLSTDIDNAEYAADIEEFFSKYGVFKQISGQVFDLARIVNDSGIPLRDVFSVSMSEHSLPCVEVTARICLIDSDSARVTMAAGSKGAFILIYDGKKDGKWSDPIFVAERTYDAVTSSDQPPNANNDNDNNSSGGEGCIAGGVAGASVAAAFLGLMLRKKR